MKFKTSMLEYCKLILTKISFSKPLFIKEYQKSLRFLPRNEAKEFRQWAENEFKLHIESGSTDSNERFSKQRRQKPGHTFG